MITINWDNILKAGHVVWDVLEGASWIWFVIIFLAQRYIPGADRIFKAIYLTIDEVDRVTDAILEEFPKLDHVQTVSDVSGEVKKILEKRYGNLKNNNINKMVQQKLQKEEGWKFKREGDKTYLEFNKKF